MLFMEKGKEGESSKEKIKLQMDEWERQVSLIKERKGADRGCCSSLHGKAMVGLNFHVILSCTCMFF